MDETKRIEDSFEDKSIQEFPLDSTEFFEKLLSETDGRKGSGIKINIEHLGQDALSDVISSVREFNISFRENGGDLKNTKLIKRNFSSKKYEDVNQRRVDNELFCIKYLFPLLIDREFYGIPQTKMLFGEGKNAILYQASVGDYNQFELFPGYSNQAEGLERAILECKDHKMAKIDLLCEKTLNELIAFRRVNIDDSHIMLKPKLQKLLLEGIPSYLPQTKDVAFDNAHSMILELGKQATWLWNHDSKISSNESLKYDEDFFITDFGIILDRINPELEGTSIREKLINSFEKYFLPNLLYNSYVFSHYDANGTNICYGEKGGHRGTFLIDWGHAKVTRNGIFDSVDYLRYSKEFNGMDKEQFDRLTRESLVQTGTKPESLYFTELYRSLGIMGILAHRLRECENTDGSFLKNQHYLGMKYRFEKYKKLAKQLCTEQGCESLVPPRLIYGGEFCGPLYFNYLRDDLEEN